MHHPFRDLDVFPRRISGLEPLDDYLADLESSQRLDSFWLRLAVHPQERDVAAALRRHPYLGRRHVAIEGLDGAGLKLGGVHDDDRAAPEQHNAEQPDVKIPVAPHWPLKTPNAPPFLGRP